MNNPTNYCEEVPIGVFFAHLLTFLMCLVRSCFQEKARPQSSQMWFLALLWTAETCALTILGDTNPWSHIWQKCFLILLWTILICSLRYFQEKARPQSSQMWFLALLWTAETCSLTILGDANLWSHIWHWCFLILLWILLICILRVCDKLNRLLHIMQDISLLLSWTLFLWVSRPDPVENRVPQSAHS